MPDCELLVECPFFNDKLKKMPKASDIMKKMYCQWHYAKCARYRVAIVICKKAIPDDMFPGDTRRSSEMLIQYDKK
jgi:hypothetical protein